MVFQLAEDSHRKNRNWMTALFLSGIADLVLTTIGMQQGIKELNPIISKTILEYGLINFALAKIIMMFFAIYIFELSYQIAPKNKRKYITVSIGSLTFLYILAIITNLCLILFA